MNTPLILLSDIHANFNALKAVFLHATQKYGTNLKFIFAGDLINYNDDIMDTLDFFRLCIMPNVIASCQGNHEDALLSDKNHHKFSSERSLKSVYDTKKIIQGTYMHKELFSIYDRMPGNYVFWEGLHILVVHGTLGDVWGDISKEHESEKYQGFDFVIHGHTHKVSHTNTIWSVDDKDCTQFINPGSVGQPRDGDSQARYAVLVKNKVVFNRVEYEIKENKCYDSYYTERLYKGI